MNLQQSNTHKWRFAPGKGSAPKECLAGLPGGLNPKSRAVVGVSCVFVGWSTGLGRRTFVVATPGSLGSSGPVWVRHCLRYLGGICLPGFSSHWGYSQQASWMLDDICRLLGLFTLLIWHYWSSISPTVLWAKARMTACSLFVCAIFMYVNDWCVCLYPSI